MINYNAPWYDIQIEYTYYLIIHIGDIDFKSETFTD